MEAKSLVVIVFVIITAITTTTTSVAFSQTNPTDANIIQKNQTGIQTTSAQSYNSTDTMMSSFKSGNKLLMQAIKDIKNGNTQGALTEINNARVQIEQQQLASA